MGYKTVEMESYKRRDHFAYFSSMAYPYVGTTANVDITELLGRVKAERLPFFLAVCWCAVRSANAVPELCQRIVDGGIIEFDQCRASHTVALEDGNCGPYAENLARDCGDFIVRRSDGVFAYQLAVVVDDALMGVNHVVRGRDLLCSAPRQVWLHEVLGYRPPRFFHTPLLLAPDGRRLAKRDRDLDMGALRGRYTPEELTGVLACYAGLLDRPEKVTAQELVRQFSWAKVPKNDVVVCIS